MDTLTTNERDALEDVFLSIESNENSFNIFKQNGYHITDSLKVAKTGDKNTKISKFMQFFNKKKKNLSK
ncbi:MAG: hypothetical protein L3I99_04565 [Sulfurimonas sp.]|nr:hypothetical protein [Sulfurimonas sp.]